MSAPTTFQQKTLWNAATGVAILILGVLLVGLIWLIGQVFAFLQPVLVPLLVAGIVAYVLDPVVRLLEKRGFSRLKSVIAVFAAMLLALMVLVAALVPGIQRGREGLAHFFGTFGRHSASQSSPKAISSPADSTSGDDLEQQNRRLGTALLAELHHLNTRHYENLLGWLLVETDDQDIPMPIAKNRITDRTAASYAKSRAGRWLFASKGAIFQTAREWLSVGSSKILGFLGLVLGMIMVPVYLFFFLKDSAAIRDHWHDYVPLKASRFKTELVETLQEINGYLISFFRGQVLVAAIDGFLVGIFLMLFGLPYGFVIGIFMAVLGVIPYIGNILCLIPACVIGYLHAQGSAPFSLSPWAYVGCVVAIFVVVQQINSLVTAPKIVGDSVGLHPLTVIFSMLFWSLVLGGFVGALLAVPLTAALKVLFRRFIWARQALPGAT